MKGGLDAQIEALYALPLADFTAARNELAKGAGKRAADVRALAKPPVPAWAVNQVYWKRRPVYEALMAAAQEMRRAHAAVLGGRSGDVRAASKAHEAQVSNALDAAIEILKDSGHPVTDATRQAMVTTLRALPADEDAGMLTRTLQPGGFEALAGLSIKGAKGAAILKPPPKPEKPAVKHADESPKDVKAREKAREAVAHAMRVVKEAEHEEQRQEFERARTARDEEKTAKAVDAAREALEEAQDALKKAEAAHAVAQKKKDAAQRSLEQAEEAGATARAGLRDARAALEKL